MKKYIVSETQLNELMEKLVGKSKMELPIGKMYSMNKEAYSNDLISAKDSSMEQETQYYMFFQNLKQIRKQVDTLLKMDRQEIDSILQDGHDWAADHISTAKDDVEEVHNFLVSSKQEMLDDDIQHKEVSEGEISEKKKKNTPTNPSLWQKSLSWAKSRYKVCPSAYCNGAAAKHYKSLGGKWKKK